MRECGDCSLCCKLLRVEELDKARGEWCEHARLPGKGCGIYGEHPKSCRDFGCGWLRNPDIPDYWRPTKSRMVIGFGKRNGVVVQIHVDPSVRDVWQREPFWSDILKIAKGRRTEVWIPGGIVEVGNG